METALIMVFVLTLAAAAAALTYILVIEGREASKSLQGIWKDL